MRTQTIVRCLPVAILIIVGLGCENQPAMDKLNTEMADLKKVADDAGDQIEQLMGDNGKLQEELDTVKAAAENAMTTAGETLASTTSTLKKEAENALQVAKTASDDAMAAVTKRADDAMKALETAKLKASEATQAANTAIGQATAAEKKAIDLQKLLDTANAKIAELEAAAKGAEAP